MRNAILGVCDKLDGLVDGIVDNLPACKPAVVHPALAALTCSGEKTASCLSADQIDSLKLAFDGPTGKGLVNSAGRQLYPNWPWDPGVSGQNGAAFNPSWRSWWLGSFTSATNNAIKLTFANALGVAYTQPPVPAVPAVVRPAVLAQLQLRHRLPQALREIGDLHPRREGALVHRFGRSLGIQAAWRQADDLSRRIRLIRFVVRYAELVCRHDAIHGGAGRAFSRPSIQPRQA